MTRTLLVLKRSARVARQIVAPNGKHRPRRAVLLPDAPLPALTEPVRHAPLDESVLEQLLDADQIATHEDVHCLSYKRTTAHAVNSDGSRRCWDCGEPTPAGAA